MPENTDQRISEYGHFLRSSDLKSFIIFEKLSEQFQSTAVKVILGFYQKFSDRLHFEQPMTHCLLAGQYGTKETSSYTD